ncbi:four-carbon acid sugar kinase family protein [Paenibacillus darwinianus]|uniref:four-carbon acid sugar kinase family protein n=1 Tax=Paenibacillus darwinianus TaxID=1380763 RepID=UPI000445E8A9|nr:four-carbon acid sugar kinase family protein [Paenibacillus darwinianus]EXX84683.1 serine kinase [Paenibacillus darwinianus]
MRIGIIADDLTGANDSGVQFSRAGLQTSVRFDLRDPISAQDDAVVLDTDSRSLTREEAYLRAKEAAQFLQQEKIEIIYKKIDSTLRGNLGVEMDAVYDVLKPDFVIIAPGYPKNGRTVKSGYHYLHGTLLHETEISRDPKCPVTESYIPKLLQEQTERPIGQIDDSTLARGYDDVKEQLDQFKEQDISYIVFDSVSEEDLERIAGYMARSEYDVVWLGSAGLANYIPQVYGLVKEKQPLHIPRNEEPVLLVVGSVTSVTRRQLDHFLALDSVTGIELDSTALVSTPERKQAVMDAALKEAEQAYRQRQHVALHSKADAEAIKEAQQEGAKRGLGATEVSNMIVAGIGELVNKLLGKTDFKGMILTGGDTAKQVCTHMGVSGFHLFDEIEVGVPIGQLIGEHSLCAVTKAGAFGTEHTFIKSMQKLQGGDEF